MNSKKGKRVTVIPGDGIGPEVVGAALRVVEAAGVRLEVEEHEAGAKVFARGVETGLPRETIDSVESTGVLLKGPLATPIGHGAKSANVTLRKLFETFGNIRPVRGLPGVQTPFSDRNLDIVIVRENVEDLYAGVEYMQTPGVALGLKLISRKGCEKIITLAFEFAISEGRKRVHCATKSNIMKLTEGMLQHTFEDIAPKYPKVEAQHILVDNCAHQLAMRPEQFDVIVTTNMNGDILSDLTSGLTGGLGFAPSANIGTRVAIFEAVHGSAPDIAGQNKANPTAIIFSAALMLRHLGEGEAATAIEQAVIYSFEQGIRTSDMVRTGAASSTSEFADVVISNLGKVSSQGARRENARVKLPARVEGVEVVTAGSRQVVGVDVFVESDLMPDALARKVESLLGGADSPFKLSNIANRGTSVYPDADAPVGLVDHYCCRLVAKDGKSEVSDSQILECLGKLARELKWMHLEKLQRFDGVDAFSKSQGQG